MYNMVTEQDGEKVELLAKEIISNVNEVRSKVRNAESTDEIKNIVRSLKSQVPGWRDRLPN